MWFRTVILCISGLMCRYELHELGRMTRINTNLRNANNQIDIKSERVAGLSTTFILTKNY